MSDSQPKPTLKDGETQRLSPNSEEYEKELQLMQDTHSLLRNLAEREKATVRAILDSLYEVGSVRLIDKSISVRALRGPLKGIAHFSKPLFKAFAWRWFRRNCPELITDWLYQQVRFGDRSLLLEAVQENIEPIDVLPTPDAISLPIDSTSTDPLTKEPQPTNNDQASEEPPVSNSPQQSISPLLERQAREIIALRGRVSWLSTVVLALAVIVCLKIFV